MEELPTMHWKPIDETEREREYREEREKYAKMAEELWLVAEGERMKGKKILEEMSYEFERQKKIRELMKKRDIKWYEKSYKKGFPNYGYKRLEKKYLTKRREAIQKRYKILKRIRTVVKPYGPMRRIFYPGKKRLVMDFHEYRKPLEGLISTIEMINWYNEPYEIYQYSPIPGTGYKYYSGESIIIYIIDEKMNEKQIEKLSKAARQREANGYNIEKCWKVIITLKDWNGCKDWTRMKAVEYIQYIKINPCETSLLLWKNCYSVNDLIGKYRHLSWCRKQGLDPWPFKWKKDVKEYFDTYTTRTPSDNSNLLTPTPGNSNSSNSNPPSTLLSIPNNIVTSKFADTLI